MSTVIMCCECKKELAENDKMFSVQNGDCEDVICESCAKKHNDATEL